MTRAALAGLLVLLAAVEAQGGDRAATYAGVNAALVEGHVLPRYARLAEGTDAFAVTAHGVCREGASSGLAALRERYHETMDAWMAVQHLRFGPIELFMRGQRLDFWPEARGRVGDAVRELLEAGDEGALAPERLRGASVAVQGLPAVEHLLYREGAPGPNGGLEARGCRLLAGIAENMREMAAGVAADWRGGEIAFAGVVASPGPDNAYFSSHKEATLAFFKSLHGGLRLIAEVKLRPVVGENIEAARPRLVESRPSARALRNIIVNLEALEALYAGERGPGLGALSRELGADPKLDPLMRKAFNMTLATARSIARPLAEAVTDPGTRPVAERLATQVQALEQIVRTRLAAALDLSVGFNALDGD